MPTRETVLMASYTIRDAVTADIPVLVAFTLQEAREAEGHAADASAVRRGVEGAFREPPFAAYWVAESDGQVVGSISVVREWSNFRGGQYWWIQSVFIAPAHRSRGLIEQLLDHVTSVARTEGALDLRLYAHASNARALRVYERCGFTTAPYVLMTRGV